MELGGRVLVGHQLHLALHHVMPLLYGQAFLTRETEDVLRLVIALGTCCGGQQHWEQGEDGEGFDGVVLHVGCVLMVFYSVSGW